MSAKRGISMVICAILLVLLQTCAGGRQRLRKTPLRSKRAAVPIKSTQPFTCRRDESFEYGFQIPNERRTSTLSNPVACDGNCTAFCIVGSVRSFFDPLVWTSYRDVLINNGFGPSGRNDVYFVLSNSTSYYNKEYYLEKSDDAADRLQCEAWNAFNIVTDVAHVDGGEGVGQDMSRCVENLIEVEKLHKHRYDWVVYSRPDLRWNTMELDAATASRDSVVFWKELFAICPRGMVHEGNFCRYPFGHVPKSEIFTPQFNFDLWQTTPQRGRRERLLSQVINWFAGSLFQGSHRLEGWVKGPGIRGLEWAAARARDFQDVSAVKRLYSCAVNVAAMACHKYRIVYQYGNASLVAQSSPSKTSLLQQVLLGLDQASDLIPSRVPTALFEIKPKFDLLSQTLLREVLQETSDEIPELEMACAPSCVQKESYFTESRVGHWHWPCLDQKLLDAKAFSWNALDFTSTSLDEFGECVDGGAIIPPLKY